MAGVGITDGIMVGAGILGMIHFGAGIRVFQLVLVGAGVIHIVVGTIGALAAGTIRITEGFTALAGTDITMLTLMDSIAAYIMVAMVDIMGRIQIGEMLSEVADITAEEIP